MLTRPAGYLWLKEYYHLNKYTQTHCSYIGNNESIEVTLKGNVDQVFGPKYAPKEDEPLSHLEFGLKYDDLSLDFLSAVFKQIEKKKIEDFIAKSPSGKISRKIGFLYEFLTGDSLAFKGMITKNYIDLLEDQKYFTTSPVRNSRWKINDNLMGNVQFCPIVRKTARLNKMLENDIKERIGDIRENYPQQIFKRAANFLYKKETRSSYEIEKERPSQDRTDKFVAILMQAGSETNENMLTKERLVLLQNTIVDSRFAAPGFRDFQNYVGELLPDYHDLVHYICPAPAILPSLMEGLRFTATKTAGVNAQIRAAMIAFGFVFIHPFEDGNGRLHRFLIHDVLVHDGVVPAGFIIPVSARMLHHMKDYDNILEKYSTPLMQRIRYGMETNGEIFITNTEEVEGYFRYPDLTDQGIYLVETILSTVLEDMPRELTFLERFDEAKKAAQNIVDMPDKNINMLLLFLHQNNGIFPKRRRDQFPELTAQEIEQMQKMFRTIFELDQVSNMKVAGSKTK